MTIQHRVFCCACKQVLDVEKVLTLLGEGCEIVIARGARFDWNKGTAREGFREVHTTRPIQTQEEAAEYLHEVYAVPKEELPTE